MTTSLRDWVESGLKTLHTSSSDFTTSFDKVVSKDVTITINGKTWTRKTFQEKVEKLGKLNAEVVIRDIADASLLSDFVRPSSNHSWSVVVVNYEVIASKDSDDKDCPTKTTEHRVFATAMLKITVDSKVTTTDTRRIMTIDETRLEGYIFDPA